MREKVISYVVPVRVSDDAPPRVEQVCAYVAQNCDRATLASTARAFGCHPNTIRRDVRRYLGMTFGELVRDMRMRRAAALIDESELPMSRVASYCGYEDLGSFYASFERRYGSSPARWHRIGA
ncbi:MAG: helix-turn-helix transcriptional regulator [Coriobacteriales bacterium]|jgi:AraC-like DNA-binding protein